jgi:NitT/TauT family transport system permease protein
MNGAARAFGLARGTARRVALPAGLFGLFLIAWQLGVGWAKVSPTLLVPPSDIWRAIVAGHALLLAHAVPTTVQLVASFVLAASVGIGAGIVLASSLRVRQAVFPHIVVFQLVPKIAIAPLFIVWFGIGAPSRLAFAIFLAFFPILVSTVSGLTGTDPGILRLCRALTATRWQTFRFVRLPYALPHIFSGLKIASTMALVGLIVGEFVTAQSGLGYLVMFASSVSETGLVYAAIAFLCVLGLALYGCVALAEHYAMKSFGASPITQFSH